MKTPSCLKKYSAPRHRSRFAGGARGRSAWMKHVQKIQKAAQAAKADAP